MAEFIKVLSISRGFDTDSQVKLYKQLGSIFFDFRVPIIMKEDHPWFLWYSCLIIDHFSFQEIEGMFRDGITLDQRMKELMEKSGQKSYIALVNLMPVDSEAVIYQRHIFNLKYFESEQRFFR